MTVADAAAFVDRVGLALVFPRDGVALPSLWEAVAGDAVPAWETEEMQNVWAWKDELAALKLACTGKHIRGWASLISLSLLPSVYALTGLSAREDAFRHAELSDIEREVAEAVLVMGPMAAPEIRRAIDRRDTAKVNRAVESLQRRLILTKAGTEPQANGWPAGLVDVLPRRYKLGKLPTPEAARRTIARAVNAPDAAALARATGWPRREAATVFSSDVS